MVAAEQLAEIGFPKIDRAAITDGVAACRWPGRLEVIAGPRTHIKVLLDAAHNPAGCAALVDFLVELDRPFTLLFGATADKDLAHMLPPLAALADRVVLTRPASPRAAAPAELAALLPATFEVAVVPEIAAALKHALAGEPDLVVACGSIFLIGALRTLCYRGFRE